MLLLRINLRVLINPIWTLWEHKAVEEGKRRVRQRGKVELQGWEGAQSGEGWKRKLKGPYAYVRMNKWAEEEEERMIMKPCTKDKDRRMDNHVGKWEKTECSCHRWGLTLFMLLCVCIANHILQPSLGEMLWCRVVFMSQCVRFTV